MNDELNGTFGKVGMVIAIASQAELDALCEQIKHVAPLLGLTEIRHSDPTPTVHAECPGYLDVHFTVVGTFKSIDAFLTLFQLQAENADEATAIWQKEKARAVAHFNEKGELE
jgi:hypothetical protein